MITPEEGAYAFETLVRHDRAYSGYIPILGRHGWPTLSDAARGVKCSHPLGSGQGAQANSAWSSFRCRKMNGPAGYGVCWLSRPV